MRNIPFAFLDEETIDQISRAGREHAEKVDAFANLAETQKSMRGVIEWPADADRFGTITAALKTAVKRLVATMEKMMEMSGPNSIANLERSLRAQNKNNR